MSKIDTPAKLVTNSLLLVILLGILIVPASSSGIMHISVRHDDRVLSTTSERVIPKPMILRNTGRNETYILKEQPYQNTAPHVVETPEATESTTSISK